MANKSWTRISLIWLPVVLGAISASLMLAQGGYGGGHGPFDGLIVTLMLPAILLVQIMPLPEWALRNDFLLVVLIPTLVNASAACVIDRLLPWRRRTRRNNPIAGAQR